MSRIYWGFPIEPDLHTEVQEAVHSISGLREDEMPLWNKRAFELVTKLIFAGVSCYYTTPIQSRLPPLSPEVKPDEVVQTIGLGLTFVVGKYLQGRTFQEMKDLADYLGRLLRLHPQDGKPYLAFPLDRQLEERVGALIERIRQTSDAAGYREEIQNAVLQIVEASVVYYYQYPSQQVPLDSHLEQVIQHGIRDITRTVRSIADQVIPTLPQDHLVHFSYYVEAMIFRD